MLIAGLLGGMRREFARDRVERSRNRDQHLLIFERLFGMLCVPRLPQMVQVAPAMPRPGRSCRRRRER